MELFLKTEVILSPSKSPTLIALSPRQTFHRIIHYSAHIIHCFATYCANIYRSHGSNCRHNSSKKIGALCSHFLTYIESGCKGRRGKAPPAILEKGKQLVAPKSMCSIANDLKWLNAHFVSPSAQPPFVLPSGLLQ